MKKIVMFLLPLALLLTACGGTTPDRAAELQARFAALQRYEAEIAVDVPRETETLHYEIALSADGERLSARLLYPAELKGVTARVEGETLTLEYEGMMLDAGTSVPNVSAFTCVPLLLRAFPRSCLSVQSEERFAGQDTLRIEFPTEQGGEKLLCTVYFAGDGAPLYAEIAEDGKIILAVEFTKFTFGDILLPDVRETTAACALH